MPVCFNPAPRIPEATWLAELAAKRTQSYEALRGVNLVVQAGPGSQACCIYNGNTASQTLTVLLAQRSRHTGTVAVSSRLSRNTAAAGANSLLMKIPGVCTCQA